MLKTLTIFKNTDIYWYARNIFEKCRTINYVKQHKNIQKSEKIGSTYNLGGAAVLMCMRNVYYGNFSPEIHLNTSRFPLLKSPGLGIKITHLIDKVANNAISSNKNHHLKSQNFTERWKNLPL